MGMLCEWRGVADGADSGRATPQSGPTPERPESLTHSPPGIGVYRVLPGRVCHRSRTCRAGHSLLRSTTAPLPCLPVWAGLWGDLPRLCGLGAVVHRLSRPSLGQEPRGTYLSSGAVSSLQYGLGHELECHILSISPGGACDP